MTSRKSSGSIRADKAVEPTRSENITVTWRRSAAPSLAVEGASRGADLRLRARAQKLDCLKQLTAVSDSRYTQVLEVFRREFCQDGGVNLVLGGTPPRIPRDQGSAAIRRGPSWCPMLSRADMICSARPRV